MPGSYGAPASGSSVYGEYTGSDSLCAGDGVGGCETKGVRLSKLPDSDI